MLSIIIPTFNEAETIRPSLEALQVYRHRGHEIIVCDGGSSDNTVNRTQGLCDTIITTDRGRARQMNAGAKAASGDIFIFVHADTRLPATADRLICLSLQKNNWGFFKARLDGGNILYRIIELLMNLRSRSSLIATGDQALYLRRTLFETIGGYPDIDIMEDIALCRRLKITGQRPGFISTPVTTSSRRWEKDGVMKTILLMWHLRLAYFLGADPSKLAKLYH